MRKWRTEGLKLMEREWIVHASVQNKFKSGLDHWFSMLDHIKITRKYFKNTCKDSDLIAMRWRPRYEHFFFKSRDFDIQSSLRNIALDKLLYTRKFTKNLYVLQVENSRSVRDWGYYFLNAENVDFGSYKTTSLTLLLTVLWKKKFREHL